MQNFSWLVSPRDRESPIIIGGMQRYATWVMVQVQDINKGKYGCPPKNLPREEYVLHGATLALLYLEHMALVTPAQGNADICNCMCT